MRRTHPRHAATRSTVLTAVLVWGVAALAASVLTMALLGVEWREMAAPTLTVSAVLLLAYGLERMGIVRLPSLNRPDADRAPPPGTDGETDETDS